MARARVRAGGPTRALRFLRAGVASKAAACIALSVLGTGAPRGAPATEGAQDSDAVLEEIVVTAQKRVENLQQVPISAQVISSQYLAEQNYNSLADLTQTVPGVNISSQGWSDSLVIRGIGSGAGAGGDTDLDQSVATFDDDIYHGRSKLSGATFLDLDRIEILKGPQSTFFGNNAIAGALNIVTKKPDDTFDATGRLLYGQFGQYAAEGAVNVPITDTLSARLAVMRNGQSGWIENVDTGREASDENNEAARLTLLFKPDGDLDATLKIEGSENRTSGTSFAEPVQFVNCPPAAPLTPSSVGSYCGQALALHLPIGLNSNENSGLPGQGSYLSTVEDVLTVNYRQWGHTFTSISGYYNYTNDMDWDVANLPTPTYTADQHERYHQFSQELRVASPTDQPVQYLAGVYFQSDDLVSDEDVNLFFLDPLIDAVPPLEPLAPYTPIGLQIHPSLEEKIYSAFGSLNWHVTDRLNLSAGLRASEVIKSGEFTNVLVGGSKQVYGGGTQLPPPLEALASAVIFPVGTSPPLDRTDKALMPSAGIQYQVIPDAMAYFSYSKGFKAGGYNVATPLPPSLAVGFGPEHVNAYELGIKSEWFDRTVLLNADVFRSDYTDLQVTAGYFNPALNAGEAIIQNAAASRSQGIEMAAQWAITKDLRLSANVTYLDSYYVSYPSATQTTLQAFCSGSYVLPYCSQFPNPVPQFTNRSGEQTPFAPRWSGTVTGSYSILLPGDYKFTTTVSPYFTSSYNEQDPYLLGTPAYVQVDARLTFESPDRRWALDLIGKNLTDRVIVISGNGTVDTAEKEEPRNFAAQIRFHW